MPNGLFCLTLWIGPFQFGVWFWGVFLLLFQSFQIPTFNENSVDSDQTPRSVESGQGLYCFPSVSLLLSIRVNTAFQVSET